MRISDWSSDVCSSDLAAIVGHQIVVQTLQVTHRIFLGGIVEEVRTFQVGLIALKRGHGGVWVVKRGRHFRSEEHTSELQSLMRISYAVFCLKKKKTTSL